MELQTEKKGRSNPQRLGEKLKRIRLNGGLSQGKMLLIVNPDERTAHNRARVSQYERMKRVPSLIETHNYAQYAGVPVEVLIDDALELPSTKKTTKEARKKSSTVNRSIGKGGIICKRKRVAVASPSCNSESSDKLSADAQENSESLTGSDAAETSPTASPESINDAPKIAAAVEQVSNPADEEMKVENHESKNSSYYESLLALPFIIKEENPCENLAVELPVATLDRLDDLLLDIRRTLPRRLRPAVQTKDIINFCLNVVLTNYAEHQNNSLVMAKTRRMIEEFATEKNER